MSEQDLSARSASAVESAPKRNWAMDVMKVLLLGTAVVAYLMFTKSRDRGRDLKRTRGELAGAKFQMQQTMMAQRAQLARVHAQAATMARDRAGDPVTAIHHFIMAAEFGDSAAQNQRWRNQAELSMQNTRLVAVFSHPGTIARVAFSQDGMHIAAWHVDDAIRVWRLKDSAAVSDPKVYAGMVWSTSTGATESGSDDADPIGTRSPADGRPGRVPTGIVEHVTGDVTAIWRAGEPARVWEARRMRALGPPMRHERDIVGASFSTDARHLATWDTGGDIRVWRLSPLVARNYTPWEAIHASIADVFTMPPAADGETQVRVLTSNKACTVRVRDGMSGERVGKSMSHGPGCVGARFHRDGRRVLIWNDQQMVGVWDPDTGAEDTAQSARLALAESALERVGYQPGRDLGRVLTWASDGVVRIRNARTGAAIGEPMRHERAVLGASFASDDQRVLSWSRDGSARVWTADTGAPVTPPLAHGAGLSLAVFSRDERRVLTADEHGSVRLWNARTGTSVGVTMRHTHALSSAFIGERFLVSFQVDGTARLWDAGTGQPLSGPLSRVGAFGVLLPDGRTLLTWTATDTEYRHVLQSRTDWPNEQLPLRYQVETGTRLDGRGQAKALSAQEWRKLATRFDEIAARLNASQAP